MARETWEQVRSRVRNAQSKARRAWADKVADRKETEPAPNPKDANSRYLAHLAALARWGKEDPKFLMFMNHFYKKVNQESEEEPDEDEEGLEEGPEEGEEE